jgi:hypothetical protein
MVVPLATEFRGPTEMTATEDRVRRFTVRCTAREGLGAGAILKLVLGGYRTLSRSGWSIRDVRVSNGDGKVDVTSRVPDPFRERFLSRVAPNRYALGTVTVTEPLANGASVEFTVDGQPSTHTGEDPTFGCWVRYPNRDTFEPVDEPTTVRIRPGPVAGLRLRVTPEPTGNGTHSGTVFAVDANGNPVDTYDGTLTFTADGEIGGLPDEGRASPATEGRFDLDGIHVTGDDPCRITATDDNRDLSATSTALFASPLGDWRHYFGGIHFHTRYSHDGERSLRDAYEYARDYLHLDVVAATDHTPGEKDWASTVETGERMNEPGRFVTLPAWEWSGPRGHANVYLCRPNVPGAGPEVADPDPWPSFGHFDIDIGEPPRLPQHHDWPDDAVVVPHHPNADGGDHWGAYDWTERCERVRLVEIVQRRGCHETDVPDDEWRVTHTGNGSSVRDALEAGYRVGFVGGTDNHRGFPTITHEGVPETGLTCFLAASRTREAIWRAMERRRTYATSGVPIRCHFAVNDAVMGSERSLPSDGDVRFDARLHGTAPIERIEVISGGEPVWTARPERLDVSITGADLPSPTGGSAYYYLRLRQADGHRAWLSPVWIDERAGSGGE